MNYCQLSLPQFMWRHDSVLVEIYHVLRSCVMYNAVNHQKKQAGKVFKPSLQSHFRKAGHTAKPRTSSSSEQDLDSCPSLGLEVQADLQYDEKSFEKLQLRVPEEIVVSNVAPDVVVGLCAVCVVCISSSFLWAYNGKCVQCEI